jgi:hypothetical protein
LTIDNYGDEGDAIPGKNQSAEEEYLQIFSGATKQSLPDVRIRDTGFINGTVIVKREEAILS